jgi:hypothetical protein
MNQFASFIQVRWGVFSQTALHGSSTHQVNRCGVDDFYGGNFRYVPGFAVQTASSRPSPTLLE